MATLKSFVDGELTAFQAARREGNSHAAWMRLERAHVLAQGDIWLHTKVHGVMLGYAASLKDWHEVLGQIVRIAVAGLGTAMHRAPAGNTGRADVPLLATMEIPPDIRAILDKCRPTDS